MRSRRIALMMWVGLTVLALLEGFSPVSTAIAQQPGQNLLTNGDFEAGWGEAWPFQDNIPEVQIAPGWRAFYVDSPPPGTAVPNYCNGDASCAWGRPEFRGTSSAEFAYRVRGGNLSQKYFSWNRQHEAGLMQQVGGIQVGARLRFEVYMQTWSCMPGEEWNECPTTPYSNNGSPMHTKVGIDPTGGMNPWAPSVVWAAEKSAYDVWVPFAVEATAQADKVTVFTYSRADWIDEIPRIANDVYIDDASLVVVAAPVPPTPVPASTAAESAPVPTAVPRSDGAVVHKVQPGETLSSIAQAYGVTTEEIMRLNGITNANLISVGQELVISLQQVSPTRVGPVLTPPPPTPTTAPPADTPLPPTDTPAPPEPAATLEPPAPTATPQPVAVITQPPDSGVVQSEVATDVPQVSGEQQVIRPGTFTLIPAPQDAVSDAPAVKAPSSSPIKTSAARDTVNTVLFLLILIPLAGGWVFVQVRQRQAEHG